jgi:type II secretory pathway pseudopilin PulG
MIEMVGVLAVMGLITAGAFVLIQSGMKSQKRNRAVTEVANIVAIIRDTYAEAPNLSMLGDWSRGVDLLHNLGVMTTTPFGTNTTYSVVSSNHEGYNDVQADFAVQMRGLEEEDCMALSERTWSQAVDASCESGVVTLYFPR